MELADLACREGWGDLAAAVPLNASAIIRRGLRGLDFFYAPAPFDELLIETERSESSVLGPAHTALCLAGLRALYEQRPPEQARAILGAQ